MKACPKCGASNLDTAKFCNECGLKLETRALIKTVKSYPPEKFAETLRQRAKTLDRKRRADIMFVLDCTGSMQGEIDGIKETIMEFADTIEKDGVRVRVGLIEFRDRLINEEHQVLKFNGEVFTNNPILFRQKVAKMKAYGGGDAPESSLDAVMLALAQPFDLESNKADQIILESREHWFKD